MYVCFRNHILTLSTSIHTHKHAHTQTPPKKPNTPTFLGQLHSFTHEVFVSLICPGYPMKQSKFKKNKEGTEGDASSEVESELMEEASASSQTSETNLLEAIQTLKTHFTIQLREIITSNQEIKDTIGGGGFLERLTSAESRISDLEDAATSLTSKEASLQKKIQELSLKVNELENNSRRSNLRLVGLPEKTEQGDIAAFLQTWLIEVLGRDVSPPPPPLRLQGQSAPGGLPRVIIMTFLNYQDKMRVMTAARLKGKVMYNGRHVMFFPDLSADVVKQRKQYDQVKQQLRNLNINFGLIFPAKMRTFHHGNCFLFHTPSEVEVFIGKTKQQTDG
uniref:L1 transposable element RRM domain-containing protein n=1 Tax=Fundulus heteroclitus TaxID=8078 RepID=A0A3Q2PSW3_FUNHE